MLAFFPFCVFVLVYVGMHAHSCEFIYTATPKLYKLIKAINTMASNMLCLKYMMPESLMVK